MIQRLTLAFLLLALACQRGPPAPEPAPSMVPQVQEPEVETCAPLPWAATQVEPKSVESLGPTVATQRQRATPEGMAQIAELLTPASVVRLRQPNGSLAIMPVSLQAQLAGPFQHVQLDGGRAGLVTVLKGFSRTAWFYLQEGHWRLDAANTAAWHPADPGPPHPENHALSLAEAVTDVQGTGALYAVLETTKGPVHCLLLEAQVPELVAHFVGLATGKRAWRDAEGAWQHKPLYDNLPFQRTSPGVWAITGDPSQKGPGGAGFHIPDVLRLDLRHDKPGMLSFVTLGQANTASSQIGLFAKPAPWADDQHLPFGLCQEIDTIEALSQQPVRSQRLLKVTFQRGWK